MRPKLTTNFVSRGILLYIYIYVSRGILLQQSGRLAQAASAYSAAISFRPALAPAHLNLGLTLSAMGRRDDAIKILDAGSKLDDNGLKDPKTNANARVSALWHLGKLLLEAGEPGRAVSVLQTRVLDHHQYQDRGRVLNLLGEAHQALGQPEAAEAWYTSALEASPNYIPAQLMMAKMLAKNVRELYSDVHFLLNAKAILRSLDLYKMLERNSLTLVIRFYN